MRKIAILFGMVIVLFCLVMTAYAEQQVPVIPLCVSDNVNVFVKEMDVENSMVGAYVDLLAGGNRENNSIKDAAMEACKKYINSAIVPLVQTAISRSGTFWKYRGTLPVGGDSSECYNSLSNVDEDWGQNAMKEVGSEGEPYVVLEPSLGLVSGLRRFSGSYGFIINKFLEVEKGTEWVYLTLYIKAEVHQRGDNPEVFSDFCMVPLAKWRRKEFRVGVDKRILAIALSQISATGIVQEVLNVFQEELDTLGEDELATIGFEMVSAICDPVQATAMAIYQSAYRITDRLGLLALFSQQVLRVEEEEVNINGRRQTVHLCYVDGRNVCIPDPLDISWGSTKFRIFLREREGENSKDLPICRGEIFATQPLRFEEPAILLQRYGLAWSDVFADEESYERMISERKKRSFREVGVRIQKFGNESASLMKKIRTKGHELGAFVRDTPRDERAEPEFIEKRERLKAEIRHLGSKRKAAQNKIKALDALRSSDSCLVLKFHKKPKNFDSRKNYSGRAEIAWDWYVQKFK